MTPLGVVFLFMLVNWWVEKHNVFYSTFTNVFYFCHVFLTFFNVFFIFFWNVVTSMPFGIRAEWSRAYRSGHSRLTQRSSAVYATRSDDDDDV